MTSLLTVVRHYWVWSSLFLCVLITFLSLTPLAELPKAYGSDKLHHFIAYGVLVLPLALRKPRYWFVVVIGFALLSGAIELIQPQVNRHGGWLDMLANVCGLGCGLVFAYFLNRYFPCQNKDENLLN